jgi:nucleotide-binding universal stress UspA family protein
MSTPKILAPLDCRPHAEWALDYANLLARHSSTRVFFVHVMHAISLGVTEEEITQLAKSRQMDLIVMGTHGRTGLGHLFLGSVAAKVVRLAPCLVS